MNGRSVEPATPALVDEVWLTGAPDDWPMQLAEIHRQSEVDQVLRVRVPNATETGSDELNDALVGGGFDAVVERPSRPAGRLAAEAEAISVVRRWTLPDTVAIGMRVLVVGLNPSPTSADRGIGFGRPGNRFWPAAVQAGLVVTPFDPHAALRDHGVGMTDLVKRTTTKASELTAAEYRDGLSRVERLIGRLRPDNVCFVGLAGWRAVRDRKALAGWQPDGLGGRPLYLMPSTSGLNAHSQLPDLTAHLVVASLGPQA